jgi:hypothetical protein
VEEARLRAPTLHFRLPGRWFRVDISGGEATEASARTIARAVVGRADEHAQVRADLRRDLVSAAAAAREAEAASVLFSTEIAAGTPLPVTLVVYAPRRLRMSPTMGTAAASVVATLTEALGQLDPVAAATAEQVGGPGGMPALRAHRVEDVEPVAETGRAMRLVADYFLPVPGSKQVTLVRLSTPLGEIAQIMLAMFDALVEAAYFDAPAPSLREVLTGSRPPAAR